ncbi:MAG TPA: nitroreductase family protein [Treponemataceae bacterium]|jgi:hypothetical protein|nr:nitroreductase family protein [Treponemataceae bacterium]
MTKTFLETVEGRRSIYALGKEKPIPQQRVEEIVRHAITHVPSPFNSQSSRTVLLFGEQSNELWNIVKETLRTVVPPEAFEGTSAKIDSFNAGWGTVLFFEDQKTVKGLQEQFPLYADNFPIWSLQSNGMLEFTVWTALENEGLGASLQHYNPLIDEAVKKHWDLDPEWKLLAQMPFGSVAAPAGDKEFMPIDQRLVIPAYKKD